MRTIYAIVLIFLSITIVSCKGDKNAGKEYEKKVNEEISKETIDEKEEIKESKTLAISLISKNESKASGSVTFTEESGLVTMVAHIEGLPEGTYSINIYEKDDNSSEDSSATSNDWYPTIESYEKWKTVEGYLKGDVGNFKANSDGKGAITFATNEWCMGCRYKDKNIIGKIIIVHQGTNDLSSERSEATINMISCGGVIQ